MGAHPMLGADPSQLAGASVDRSLLWRVWRFARPYRWMLVGYLAIVVATALVQLVPPLLFRSIIDSAIPDGDRAYLNVLAGLAVLSAFAGAALPGGGSAAAGAAASAPRSTLQRSPAGTS